MQRVVTIAAFTPSSRVECVTLEAAHIHCPRKEVHDDIAAAENGDSYGDVYESFFQKRE